MGDGSRIEQLARRLESEEPAGEIQGETSGAVSSVNEAELALFVLTMLEELTKLAEQAGRRDVLIALRAAIEHATNWHTEMVANDGTAQI